MALKGALFMYFRALYEYYLLLDDQIVKLTVN